MGKKKFAKKEDVRHFRLMSRSMHDANVDDPTATPLVLEAFVPPNKMRRPGAADELMQIPETLQTLGPAVFGRGEHQPEADDLLDDDLDGSDDDDIQDEEDQDGIETRLAQLDSDCYFPKDGYNYEKHLRAVSRVDTGKAPAVDGGIQVMDAVPNMANEPTASESMAMSSAAMPSAAAAPLQHSVPMAADKAWQEEEEAALAALDEADLYEEMDDDLIQELLPSGAKEPETLLWGEHEDDGLPNLEAFKASHQAALRLEGANLEATFAAHRAAAGAEGDEPVDEEQFAELMGNEYGDEELGDVEEEDIIGENDINDMEDVLDEFLEDQQAERTYLKSMQDPREGLNDKSQRVIEETKRIVERYEAMDRDEEESTDESDGEDRRWDCETVLTTNSNLSNRPGKIGTIKVLKKQKVKPIREEPEELEDAFRVAGATGSKLGIFNGKYVLDVEANDKVYRNKKSTCVMRFADGNRWGLFQADGANECMYACDGDADAPPHGEWNHTEHEFQSVNVQKLGEEEEDDVVELPDVVLTRDKTETAEEKRARKQGVKEMRKLCREMKKSSKDTYKKEGAKLNAAGTNDLRSKVRYNKL